MRCTALQETVYSLSGCPRQMTLALVADLHDRPGQAVLRSLKARRPQAICLVGDLIHGDVDRALPVKLYASKHALPFLAECIPIAPTFYALGNHEWALGEADLALLQSMGVHVLHNRWEALAPGIWMGGLSSARVAALSDGALILHSANRYPAKWKRYLPFGSGGLPPMLPSSAWLEDFCRLEGYKILLSHHPEYWDRQEPFLRERAIDLVLSGHAHGGQVRFYDPFSRQWRGLFAPEQGFFPKMTAGIHEGACGRMVISRGLANTAGPIPRLMNPRELVYIDLSPDQAQTSQQNK